MDLDPNVHTMISKATGIESKWLQSPDLPSDHETSESHPLAVFLDAKMSLSGPANGTLIPKLKDLWPLSPVIITTVSEDRDIITEAVALGADDFVHKPFSPEELNSRLNIRLGALKKKAAKESIEVGDLIIDTMQRSVASTKGQKFLSPTEIKLVSELAKSHGQVVPREMLKRRCWPNAKVSDNALNRKLYEVRRRLEPLSDKVTIRTIYGVGFILDER